MDLLQDVVVIFDTEEPGEDHDMRRSLDLSIEFSNSRSIDVFGIDLSQLSTR